MEASKNGFERITTSVVNLKHLVETASVDSMIDGEQAKLDVAKEYFDKFEVAMDDDFNTADAISAIFELVKYANSNSAGNNSKQYLNALIDNIIKLSDVLGLIVVKKDEILDKEIDDLIAERQQARKDKNFARADEIRDLLISKEIILEDTREGVRWKRR